MNQYKKQLLIQGLGLNAVWKWLFQHTCQHVVVKAQFKHWRCENCGKRICK